MPLKQILYVKPLFSWQVINKFTYVRYLYVFRLVYFILKLTFVGLFKAKVSLRIMISNCIEYTIESLKSFSIDQNFIILKMYIGHIDGTLKGTTTPGQSNLNVMASKLLNRSLIRVFSFMLYPWFVWFVWVLYGISTFVGYLTPNPFLYK